MANGTDRDGEFFALGTQLSTDEAESMERMLRSDLEDVDTRIKLIGYYSPRPYHARQARYAVQRWHEHFLWMVAHRPHYWISGWTRISNGCTGGEFHTIREKWLEHVEAHPKNITILENAARSVSCRDFELAEKLFRRLKILQPNSGDWGRDFLELYLSELEIAPKSFREKLIQSAFCEGDAALKLKMHRSTRTLVLWKLCDLAIEQNELSRARIYSREMEQIADDLRLFHDRVFTALGRVALRNNDVNLAKSYLLKMKSHGYSRKMTLPHELLEHGEFDAVLDYLRFYLRDANECHRPQIKKWIQELKQHKVPDLRNLKPGDSSVV